MQNLIGWALIFPFDVKLNVVLKFCIDKQDLLFIWLWNIFI